jgi:saccharopine dehydrogenase-like NADP-dependent oxidoreductase
MSPPHRPDILGPMAPVTGKQSNPPLTIVFFGLGAVGSSMLICLAELAEREGIPVRFKVFSIDPAGARDALYHAERLMKRVEIIGVPTFDRILDLDGPGAEKLAGAALLINAAIPQFNCPIIQLGIRLGAHTLDLASDMYNPETASSLTFNQYAHDAALQEKGVAALINMGVSPGITNFLIGDQICRISSEHRKELEIESIDLYLLEDIDADAIIFSWAPAVALDELSQSPLQLRDGRMIVHEPFTAARDYQFPHEPRMWRQYPLYQEELLSLHRSYPHLHGRLRGGTRQGAPSAQPALQGDARSQSGADDRGRGARGDARHEEAPPDRGLPPLGRDPADPLLRRGRDPRERVGAQRTADDHRDRGPEFPAIP